MVFASLTVKNEIWLKPQQKIVRYIYIYGKECNKLVLKVVLRLYKIFSLVQNFEALVSDIVICYTCLSVVIYEAFRNKY